MTELNNISKINFGNNVVLTRNNVIKNNYSIEYLMNKVNNKPDLSNVHQLDNLTYGPYTSITTTNGTSNFKGYLYKDNVGNQFQFLVQMDRRNAGNYNYLNRYGGDDFGSDTKKNNFITENVFIPSHVNCSVNDIVCTQGTTLASINVSMLFITRAWYNFNRYFANNKAKTLTFEQGFESVNISNNSVVNKVYLPNTIHSIIFDNCSELEYIYAEDASYVVEIIISNCPKLKKIFINGEVEKSVSLTSTNAEIVYSNLPVRPFDYKQLMPNYIIMDNGVIYNYSKVTSDNCIRYDLELVLIPCFVQNIYVPSGLKGCMIDCCRLNFDSSKCWCEHTQWYPRVITYESSGMIENYYISGAFGIAEINIPGGTHSRQVMNEDCNVSVSNMYALKGVNIGSSINNFAISEFSTLSSTTNVTSPLYVVKSTYVNINSVGRINSLNISATKNQRCIIGNINGGVGNIIYSSDTTDESQSLFLCPGPRWSMSQHNESTTEVEIYDSVMLSKTVWDRKRRVITVTEIYENYECPPVDAEGTVLIMPDLSKVISAHDGHIRNISFKSVGRIGNIIFAGLGGTVSQRTVYGNIDLGNVLYGTKITFRSDCLLLGDSASRRIYVENEGPITIKLEHTECVYNIVLTQSASVTKEGTTEAQKNINCFVNALVGL